MNPDVFNMEVRKFLKQVGVTSQHEIENAVRQGLESGEIKGDEKLRAVMTLKIDQLEFTHIVEDDIALDDQEQN
jgi:hypothetical protein